MYHILIIPIAHVASLEGAACEQLNVISEMNRYKYCVESMYQSLGMVGVLFEINREGGIHSHWQMVPVPKEKEQSMETAFRAFGEGIQQTVH